MSKIRAQCEARRSAPLACPLSLARRVYFVNFLISPESETSRSLEEKKHLLFRWDVHLKQRFRQGLCNAFFEHNKRIGSHRDICSQTGRSCWNMINAHEQSKTSNISFLVCSLLCVVYTPADFQVKSTVERASTCSNKLDM